MPTDSPATMNPRARADRALQMAREGLGVLSPDAVIDQLVKAVSLIARGQLDFGSKSRTWEFFRATVAAVVRRQGEIHRFQAGIREMGLRAARLPLTLAQTFNLPAGAFQGINTIDIGRIAAVVVYSYAPELGDIVPADLRPKEATIELEFPAEELRKIVHEELESFGGLPKVEFVPGRGFNLTRVPGVEPPPAEEEVPPPAEPTAEEAGREVEQGPTTTPPVEAAPSWPAPEQVRTFTKAEVAAYLASFRQLFGAKGTRAPGDVYAALRKRFTELYKIPPPEIYPEAAPPPPRFEAVVRSLPPPEAPPPAAPPAPGPGSDRRAAQAWAVAGPETRTSLLSRFGLVQDPLAARRRAGFSWAALNPTERGVLLEHLAEWAAEPKSVQPIAAGSFTKQGRLGELPAGSAERGHVSLEQRYEPVGLADIVGNRSIVEFLEAAIRTNRIPSLVFLVSEAGGVGKTSLARAFAHDYLNHEQQRLEERGVESPDIVTPEGNPTGNDYLEVRGQDLALPGAAQRVQSILRSKPPNAQHGVKRIVLLNDVDKVSPTAITALKTLLEPQGRDKPIPTYIVASNIVIVTSNATDTFSPGEPLVTRGRYFYVETPNYDDIRSLVARVSASEGITCPGEVVDDIVRLSAGVPRAALRNLDDAVTLGRCSVTPRSE